MILLSFDIEEFDAPLEHGVELPFEEQMRTSVEGTRKILACLARHRVKATSFCTANFALHAKDLILDIQRVDMRSLRMVLSLVVRDRRSTQVQRGIGGTDRTTGERFPYGPHDARRRRRDT